MLTFVNYTSQARSDLRLLRSGAVGLYDRKTRRVRDLSYGDARGLLEIEVRRGDHWHRGQVKRERWEFHPTIRSTVMTKGASWRSVRG